MQLLGLLEVPQHGKDIGSASWFENVTAIHDLRHAALDQAPFSISRMQVGPCTRQGKLLNLFFV